MNKKYIIQASPSHTGSTVLTNLLYGMYKPNQPVYYHEQQTHPNRIIVKTHNLDYDYWANKYPHDSVFFITSKREDDLHDQIAKKYCSWPNVLIFDYNELNETKENSLESIVENVFHKVVDFIGSEISLPTTAKGTKRSMYNRIIAMNQAYEKIKHLPFGHVDKFYHLHGSHRGTNHAHYRVRCLRNIVVLKSNKHYRLGDLILARGERFCHDRDVILRDDEYKGRFLRDYLENRRANSHIENSKHTVMKNIDRKALNASVAKHSKSISTENNILYINIRTGDAVMDPYGNMDENAYGVKNKLFIFNPEKLLDQIHNKLQNHSEIDTIMVVTAMHFGDNEIPNTRGVKTWQYSDKAVDKNIELLEQIFKDIQKTFSLPLTIIPAHKNQARHIDNQFITLCTAKHVIIDGANFGELITTTREIYGQN